ncbi:MULTISPECIES: DUF418 domain-containing protein [unclassified Sphingomonas]|uniref:DUF418 domain-containing protein n=1 Tax=unclassified Sphingomonas TaxID=196159 RepID=UPI0006F49505|nr:MULTISPECIES: DUF418 domain-containing protein [unclassified Sphingomonas]KQM58972.1 hypothetical protein ASE65_11420 [Sphingomonas sp. Leaf16]KQN11228.1 hypothetical protein ASE81_12410 [Sphingomonas sp. Leaf29]KQN18528.1 hypothetical protein ASE83_12335 [Sphingomonas sp. Leaf32]
MIAPHPAADRIVTLDVVRGVAVMGILFVNILSFALPDVARLSPYAWGITGPADLWAYFATMIAFDGKMRGLFSFLFGASLLLVVDRAEAAGADPAAVHYRRMGWLFVLGLAHAALLWSGDILMHYALVGSVAYAFRHSSVRRMIACGVALAAIEWLLLAAIALSFVAMQSADTPSAAQGLRDFENGFGIPTPAVLAQEIALFRGGYAGILHHNGVELATTLYNTVFIGFETLAYMLFGMAALRSGMLTGTWPPARLWRWAIGGIGIGVAGYTLLAAWMLSRGIDARSVILGAFAMPPPLRAVMIPGYAALILLIARRGGGIAARCAAVGQMALSNYLATTIVMCFVFYGWGLGQFGTWSRATLYLPVLAMGAVMLFWSSPWLARYRYGPFEWLWRSLARWQVQPLRRR